MLISEIRDEIITDLGGDSNDTTLQANVFTWIKSALRRFPRFTRSKLIFGSSTTTLTSGSYDADIPSGVTRIKKNGVYYLSNGNRKTIDWLSDDDFNAQFNSSAVGAPTGWRRTSDKLEFLRSADQAYTIYVEHFKEIDNVQLTDTWSYGSDVAEILKDGVKAYYLESEGEETDRADRKMALFKVESDKLEADYTSDDMSDYVEET